MRLLRFLRIRIVRALIEDWDRYFPLFLGVTYVVDS